MKSILEKKELEELVKQILKTDSFGNIEKTEESNESEKLDDYLENENLGEENFTETLNNLTEENYHLFLKDAMPEFYKLSFEYGGELFEGYYDSVIESVRKTKETSFSSMGAEYEYETLNNSLVIIRCAKEFKSDALVLDSAKKACVEAYKAQSLTWWQVLYELEGKVIFCTQNISGQTLN